MQQINKILIVDFVNKKVTGGYQGESGQTFVPLSPERLDAERRTVEAIERVNVLINQLKSMVDENKNK